MPTKPIERLLFAQGGLCFFCGHALPKEQASVEHLLASANGGANADENCVACCKTLNQLLGSRSLKEKFQVVLAQRGRFHCPNGVDSAKPEVEPATPRAAIVKTGPVPQVPRTAQPVNGHPITATSAGTSAVMGGEPAAPRILEFARVVANLRQRGESKPKTLRALTNTLAAMGKDSPPSDVEVMLKRLQAKGLVRVDGTKVTYEL